MKDKRKHVRAVAAVMCDVFDPGTGKDRGCVVNFSFDGLGLVTPALLQVRKQGIDGGLGGALPFIFSTHPIRNDCDNHLEAPGCSQVACADPILINVSIPTDIIVRVSYQLHHNLHP